MTSPPITSLADPAWGPIVPPDPKATLTWEQLMTRGVDYFTSPAGQAQHQHPCYVCGDIGSEAAIIPCARCRRPVCNACWRLVGRGYRRCCRLDLQDEIPVPPG